MNDYDHSDVELEKNVLHYLQREFGEPFGDGASLKLSDLEYEGQFDLDGREKLCWSFPSGSHEMWATAHKSSRYKWVFGMQKKPDFGEPKSGYEKLYLQLSVGDKIKEYKFAFEAQDEINWEVDSKEIIIDKKRKMVIFSSVNFYDNPPKIELEVDYQNRSYAFFCSQSINANFHIDDDVYMMANVGDIDDSEL